MTEVFRYKTTLYESDWKRLSDTEYAQRIHIDELSVKNKTIININFLEIDNIDLEEKAKKIFDYIRFAIRKNCLSFYMYKANIPIIDIPITIIQYK